MLKLRAIALSTAAMFSAVACGRATPPILETELAQAPDSSTPTASSSTTSGDSEIAANPATPEADGGAEDWWGRTGIERAIVLRYMSDVDDLLRRGARDEVVKQMLYPFRVNTARCHHDFASPEDLRPQFSAAFGPSVLHAFTGAPEPVGSRGIFLDGGTVWMSSIEGRFGVFALNLGVWDLPGSPCAERVTEETPPSVLGRWRVSSVLPAVFIYQTPLGSTRPLEETWPDTAGGAITLTKTRMTIEGAPAIGLLFRTGGAASCRVGNSYRRTVSEGEENGQLLREYRAGSSFDDTHRLELACGDPAHAESILVLGPGLLGINIDTGILLLRKNAGSGCGNRAPCPKGLVCFAKGALPAELHEECATPPPLP